MFAFTLKFSLTLLLLFLNTYIAMGPVSAVSFDYSGLYVAAASGSGSTYGVNIYSSKDKDWGSIKVRTYLYMLYMLYSCIVIDV